MAKKTIYGGTVSSMDKSSCKMEMERFIALRGTPWVTRSDNGTNFVGTEKEFLNCIQSWNAQAPAKLEKKGNK